MPRTQTWGIRPTGPDDPEFSAKIKPLLGTDFALNQYQSALDPSRARQVSARGMGGLLGLYVTNNASPETLEMKSRSFGVPVKKDTVWGVGNTTPSTWAHEFRHRGGVLDEYQNRLLDAFNAQSPAQWRESVEMHRQYRGLESPDEAERDLVETLKKNTALFGFKGISPDPQRFSNSVAKGLDQTANAWDSTRKRAYEAATKFPWMLWANKRGLLAE